MQLMIKFRDFLVSAGFSATLITATMASSSSASMPDKHAPTQSPQGGDKTIGASAPAASSQVVYPTRADIMRLVANMDPDELTIIGHWPPNDNPLSPDSAEDMTVVYCSTVIGQECNTPCTLYNGPGNVCLAAPNTNCLLATVNVSFCATSTCTGSVPASCNILNQFCPTHAMPGGYCDTPDTQSIGVPAS